MFQARQGSFAARYDAGVTSAADPGESFDSLMSQTGARSSGTLRDAGMREPGPLAELFPAGCAAVERCSPGDPAALHAGEARQVEHCVPARIREFAAGRDCARSALAALGLDGATLLADDARRVCWPAGYTGSITHCGDYTAAVVAHGSDCVALGIDAERVGEVSADVFGRICTPSEAQWLERATPARRNQLAALILSAKEAFYKCQHALAGESLEFRDVAVDFAGIELGAGSFAVRPLRDLRIAGLRRMPCVGRFQLRAGLVICGIAFTP